MAADSTGPAVEELRTLLLFAEQGEGKAVGKLLGLDASGISRRLRRFQDAGLLAKIGPALELTERGRRALPALRSLLRQYDQLVRWLREPRKEEPRTLVVATGAPGAAYYLPPALALFRARLEGWAVRTHICRGRDRIRGVADGSFDLAIVSHDVDQVRSAAGAMDEEGSLEVELLAEQPLCLLASGRSAEGAALGRVLEGQTLPLTWLAEFELVGLDPRSGLRRQLEQWLRAAGRELRFGPDAGGWLAAREYARHGLGVALMPLGLLERSDRDDCVVRLLSAEVMVRDCLVRRRGDESEGQTALRQALLEAARRRQEEVRARWQGILPG